MHFKLTTQDLRMSINTKNNKKYSKYINTTGSKLAVITQKNFENFIGQFNIEYQAKRQMQPSEQLGKKTLCP